MGQVIGAVVADTQVHAQRAAKAVKVEYEELEPIITIKVRSCILFHFWKYRIPFFNIIRYYGTCNFVDLHVSQM